VSQPPGRDGEEDDSGLLEPGFCQAYRAHAGAAYRSAYFAAHGDHAAAQDATQQAFLEAFRAWPRLRHSTSGELRAWLCDRARKRVIDSWRATGAEYPDDNVPEQPDPHHGEDAALAVIAADLFWKKVSSPESLSSRARRVAYLAWNEGWTVTEIARHLGVARRTVSRDLEIVRAEALKPGRTASLEGGKA
jgi:RNA polymerase sigma factor (sigma-70 family)